MSKASRLLKHIEEAGNSSDYDSFLQDTQLIYSFPDLTTKIEGQGDYSYRELESSPKNAIVIKKGNKEYMLIAEDKTGSDGKKEWHLIKDYKGGDNPVGKVWSYTDQTWRDWTTYAPSQDRDKWDKQIERIKKILKKDVDKDGKVNVKASDASYQSDVKNLVNAIRKHGTDKKTLVKALTGETVKNINEADTGSNSQLFDFGKWSLVKNIEKQDLFVVTKDRERAYIIGKEGDQWQIASPSPNGDMDDYQLYDWNNNSMVKADKEIKQKYKNITNVVRNMKFKNNFMKDTNPENKLDKAGKNIGGYAGMLLGGPLGAYVGKKAGEWAANKARKII